MPTEMVVAQHYTLELQFSLRTMEICGVAVAVVAVAPTDSV
jgi:hypothetical protein